MFILLLLFIIIIIIIIIITPCQTFIEAIQIFLLLWRLILMF